MARSPHAEHVSAPAAEPGQQGGRPWLLFVHQLPSSPSNLRVRTWRRLQQLGAMPIKQAVYVLPDTPGTREAFDRLKTDVRAVGGDASVFAGGNIDAWSDDTLVEEFRRSRQDAYAELARDVEANLTSASDALRPHARVSFTLRALEGFRERLTAIEKIDFFQSVGRDRVVTLLRQLEEHLAETGLAGSPLKELGSVPVSAAAYRGRLWVTRPRPGVDRLSSAWLIRRFLDPEARFAFAADRNAVPIDAIPFDMFGVGFSHQSADCTFETLRAVFGIQDPAVVRLGRVVHDVDLKDNRFGAPEAATVGALVAGLRLAYADDAMLLEQGMAMFESLYRAFEQEASAAGPRPLAPSQERVTAKGALASRRRGP
jgi:hypothetical protein